MAKLFGVLARHDTLNVLAVTVVGIAVISGLYLGRTVLIPVALAIFLAFPLAQAVAALERLRLGRTISVAVVVVVVAVVFGGFLWLVKVQLTNLGQQLPTYTANIQQKVYELRQFGSGDTLEKLRKLTDDISEEWAKPAAVQDEESEDSSSETVPEPPEETSPMPTPTAASPASETAQPKESTLLARIPTIYVFPVLTLLAQLALALVFVVFMLLGREALRDRLIHLMGNGRITTTTKALEDAGERIGHFLRTQLMLNVGYGLIWGLALYFVGIDYALLWGLLVAVLKYIPYIGTPIAALPPVALSLGQFPGWWIPLTVIGIWVALELISNNIIEPLMYGHSIGVSAVAMMFSATFWTFLWGPVGLLLSGPLTVCLVVLGQRVPGLKFFALLLGDAPALDPDMRYYQRLLAKDQEEALGLVRSQVKVSSPDGVYDDLLVPALVHAKRDRAADFLTDEDEKLIFEATHTVLENLEKDRAAAIPTVSKSDTFGGEVAKLPRIRVLACPAGDRADSLALEMLRQLLNPLRWDVEVAGLETLTAELVEQATEENSALLCIGALPPGGLEQTRYLCKRLRIKHPSIKIIVGRWGLKEDVESHREQLHEAGADLMVTTLLEARKRLNDWLPIFTYEAEKIAAEPEPLLTQS